MGQDLKKDYEVDFEKQGIMIECPMQGRSFYVSVEETCLKGCDFFRKIIPENKAQGIPKKLHCKVPVDFFSVIKPLKKANWSTKREMKKE
jgi:hypothetical protein